MPLFSIIVPTYNRAHLIEKTIGSILAQEFNDFELIIVDDGSIDDTDDVVLQFSDYRISYFKKDNEERGAARNFGRTKSNGEYINFFDSDDLMYPNHLRTAQKLISQKLNPEFFHLGYDFKTPEGLVTEKIDHLDNDIAEKALFDNFLSCNGIFVRRDIAEKYQFEEDRNLASCEDWELWIRIMSRYTLHYSNEITTSVVGHDMRSLSTIATEKIVKRDLLLIDLLKKDEAVLQRYGNRFNRFIADRYTFFMLRYVGENNKKKVFSWSLSAMKIYPRILFSKRFLVSLKKALL